MDVRVSVCALVHAPLPELLDFREHEFVVPGDEIHVNADAGFLKGHGTQLVDGRLLATTCGTVMRVNKLVSVKPLKSRYAAETGDVVVGRVTEVSGKRWKVDICARQDALLMLSAVTLPGGVQRRRTAVDELNMRTLFAEGDLISAEVQTLMGDGIAALHTRSSKYGRLSRGALVRVPPLLVARLKQHFVPLPHHGVDVILGANGWVWVGEHVEAVEEEEEDVMETDRRAVERSAAAAARPDAEAPGAWAAEGPGAPVGAEARERVGRIAAAARCLASLRMRIHPAGLLSVADAAIAWGVAVKDMGGDAFLARITEAEAARAEAAAAGS